MFECQICQKIFNSKYDLNRHKNRKKKCTLQQRNEIDEIGERRCYQCVKCGTLFNKSIHLTRHESICNKNKIESTSIDTNGGDINGNPDCSRAIHSYNNTTNNNNNNNCYNTTTTINNIVNLQLSIPEPGEESTAHITDEKFLDILNYRHEIAVVKLFRLYYYSKDAPQNSTWCVPYVKDEYGALVYNKKTNTVERWASSLTVDVRFDNFIRRMQPTITKYSEQQQFYQQLNLQQRETLETLIGLFGMQLSEHDLKRYKQMLMTAYNYRHMAYDQWEKLGISVPRV